MFDGGWDGVWNGRWLGASDGSATAIVVGAAATCTAGSTLAVVVPRYLYAPSAQLAPPKVLSATAHVFGASAECFAGAVGATGLHGFSDSEMQEVAATLVAWGRVFPTGDRVSLF